MHTVMHFMNKETNHTQTSSGLLGGTNEKPITGGDKSRGNCLKMIDCAVFSSVEVGQWV